MSQLLILYIITKLCNFDNCKKRASYGLLSNPIRCVSHKETNMKY